jgi:hypothetical protein
MLVSVLGWKGQPGSAFTQESVAPIQVLASSVNQLVVAFHFVDPQLQQVPLLDDNLYTEIRAQEAGEPDVGLPAVPVYGAWILIPNGFVASLADVNPGSPLPLGDDIRLAPVQPPQADVDDAPLGPFTKNETVYGTNDYFPYAFAQLGEPQVLRGQKMTWLRLYPYRYNPVTRHLEVYPNLQVTIQFSGSGLQPDDNPWPIPWRLRSDVFDKMYKEMAINANEVLAAEYEAAGPKPAHPYGWNYIILTSSTLKTAADQLATWKQQQGYTVLVEVIPANYPAAKLKNALLGAYQNWGIAPEYILILGDADVVIPNYKTWHPYNGTLYQGITDSQGYTGTDLYYATLESSNPNDPDADLLADVLIGRMSVDTLLDAEARVRGSINYEKSPIISSYFYNQALLAANFQDGMTYTLQLPGGAFSTVTTTPDGIEDRRFTQTAEDIAIYLEGTEGKTIRRQYYAKSNVTPTKWNDDKQYPQEFKNFAGDSTAVGGALPSYLLRTYPFNWNGDDLGIQKWINNGTFLVLHRGHGARDHWANPFYPDSYVYLLNNWNKLPVVWSINCETGWFDNETDFKQKSGQTDWTATGAESMSEQWERPFQGKLKSNYDYGAVGVVASTRVSYSGYNEYLTLGMADAIWPDLINGGGVPGVGSETVMASVLELAKSYMLTKYGLDSYARADMEGFHWFGDPSLEIRTEPPALTLQVVYPLVWSSLLYPHDLIVQVAQNSPGDSPDAPLAGVRVSLSNPAYPEQVWSAYSDGEGKAIFHNLLLEYPGEYNLLAWLTNTAPVSGTMTVEPGSAGGIHWDSWGYTCSDRTQVHVADKDLAGTSWLDVSLTTDNGDSETLSLDEVQPGYFQGMIATRPTPVAPDDGILQVHDGGQIVATYHDANDGTDSTAVVSDTASIDCSPPEFGGLQTITGICPAILSWAPANDINGPIQYRIYRSQNPGDITGTLFDTTWANYYADTSCFKGDYFYMVRAVDMLGNEDSNSQVRMLTVPGVFLPVIRR